MSFFALIGCGYLSGSYFGLLGGFGGFVGRWILGFGGGSLSSGCGAGEEHAVKIFFGVGAMAGGIVEVWDRMGEYLLFHIWGVHRRHPS